MPERDQELEAEAVRVLGYTPDQVKRKTMAELKKELKDSRHTDSRKKKTRNVTFSAETDRGPGENDDNDDHDKSSRRRRHSRSVDSPGRDRETENENDDLNHLVDLHHVLRAKVNFTTQLERDPDFSRADLAEWDKSVERSRRRLDDALARSDLGANGGAEVKKLWKRREEKIAEMQGLGLLDGELLKAWQAKQNLLKQIYQDLQ